MTLKMIPLVLCLLVGIGAAVVCQVRPQPAPLVVNVDFARGVADAKVDFAEGRGSWFFHWYSNMPGPDDPVLARERDVFVAVLTEKGIDPRSSNGGCTPAPGLLQYADGYNSIADARLKEKFGANYMAAVHQEVARRLKELPQPSA